MAGLKETPRQKMIGMMYLVLTALLALNVQKEVLLAFVELNDGIEKTTFSNRSKNENLYADFKFALGLDPTKTQGYYQSAQSIKKRSESLQNYLDSAKTLLISETEGISFEEADTIALAHVEKLENFDETTRIMIGPKEDASEGMARKIKQRIQTFSDEINKLLKQHHLEEINIPIDFSDQEKGVLKKWEIRTFYDTPLAGSVSILSKYIGDISNAEYVAVSKLLSKVDGEDIPVDTVIAKVIPKSNYVLQGEFYESQIFLGAYSTTVEPVVRLGKLTEDKKGFVGDYTELPIENGSAIYSFRPEQQGLFEYSGMVTIKDKQGIEKNYPFESSYVVAQPSAVISATAMNVLYKGLKNPLSVSVPGIPDDQLVLQTNGNGTAVKISDGNYELVVNNGAPAQISLSVSAIKEDGTSQLMGTLPFRTKYLPKPSARIGDIEDSGSMRKNELIARQGIIGFYSRDFVYKLPLTVVSFKCKVYSGNASPVERIIQGNKFSEVLETRFQNLRINDEVHFYDIMVEGQDKIKHKVNPLIIRIRN